MAAHKILLQTPDSKTGARTKTEGQVRKRVAREKGQEPNTSVPGFGSKILLAPRKKPMTCKAYAPLPENEVAEPIGL